MQCVSNAPCRRSSPSTKRFIPPAPNSRTLNYHVRAFSHALAPLLPFPVASYPPPVAGNRTPEYVVRDAPSRQPSGSGRMRRSALLPKRFRETVVCPPPTRVGTPDAWGVAMTTLLRTRCRYRLAYIIAAAALTAEVLIAAAGVAPQRSQAEDSVQATPQAGAVDRCS